MGIYNYIKMISNISEYRQKKVDQLVKNLERCSKIVSNIQKIDSYIIQQTGGDDAIIQELTQELTARKAKIMTPDASKKVISAEQLNKLENTMRKVFSNLFNCFALITFLIASGVIILAFLAVNSC